ncbi:LOW QUALITY PROTEIN: uncharacterized protein J5F26_003047 [Ciconia maguari]
MLLPTVLEFELLLSQPCGSRRFPSLRRLNFPFWADVWVIADEKQSKSQQGGSRMTGEFGIEPKVFQEVPPRQRALWAKRGARAAARHHVPAQGTSEADNYDEDFEDDDVYGQSVEDDYCISPSTAAQFIYSRRDKPATFAEPLEEEYGYEGTDDTADYFTYNHQLTEVDRAHLNSCLDQMREVLAESVPEQTMVQGRYWIVNLMYRRLWILCFHKAVSKIAYTPLVILWLIFIPSSTASLTDTKLGNLTIITTSESTPHFSGMPELTGSLSSLALSKVSPLREVENLSLSGFNSETIEQNKKPKRGLTPKRADLSLLMKALRARPSAFALTLCLRYPPKGDKRRTCMHKSFLYSRQIQDVKPKETGPIIAITPFDFKSASPDDIVKANQKRAFTRE